MIPKFRVWLKDVKEMYTVITMHIEHEKVICEHWRFGETVPLSYRDDKDVVLMQSTGLTDKNGREIYEGDIIDKSYLNGVHDEIGVVTFGTGFDSDGYQAESWLGWVTDKGSSVLDVHEKCEVIGNVFEDKNLLNEEDKSND
ncbi:YopX family protein [Staphylococcus simulans]|uniref:YopX family protein n=1 Tax=Staphylococcus simulans TaxID=1286 RepID=UPI0021D2FD5C|nr:YopX family protein [Staphylococcus simulans]UXR29851.1 YopX family protein [Staphylococcus simulans]